MDLHALRIEYMRSGLAESDADADPIAQFERWFRDAEAAGLSLVNAMVLSTVGPDGAPSSRAVLLKEVQDGRFLFYTDTESRKGTELAGDPRASLVFLWASLERQVRIEGRTSRLPDLQADRYFSSRPLGARRSAHASRQSRPVQGRAELEAAVERVTGEFGANPPRPARWGGYALLPSSIEFWQGRENRLHDRLLYQREREERSSPWRRVRLAP